MWRALAQTDFLQSEKRSDFVDNLALIGAWALRELDAGDKVKTSLLTKKIRIFWKSRTSANHFERVSFLVAWKSAAFARVLEESSNLEAILRGGNSAQLQRLLFRFKFLPELNLSPGGYRPEVSLFSVGWTCIHDTMNSVPERDYTTQWDAVDWALFLSTVLISPQCAEQSLHWWWTRTFESYNPFVISCEDKDKPLFVFLFLQDKTPTVSYPCFTQSVYFTFPQGYRIYLSKLHVNRCLTLWFTT